MTEVSNKILFLDQLDSFSYNIVHLLQSVPGTEVIVVRYDDHEAWESLLSANLKTIYQGVVIGPGPGKPSDYPRLIEFLRHNLGNIPVLGICLGLQIMGESLGFAVSEAKEAVHGKMRLVNHSGTGLFQNIVNPMPVGRYHSLCVMVGLDILEVGALVKITEDSPVKQHSHAASKWFESENSSALTMQITGVCDGVIMAFTAEKLRWDGVQFHPESVLTPAGRLLISNWLSTIY